MSTKKQEEKKRDKFDEAFLFVLSSTGLIITIFEVFQRVQTENTNPLRSFAVIPIIFLATILPFCIGYLRGAISINSTNERLRGWIYYFVGLSSYFAFILSALVDDYVSKQMILLPFLFVSMIVAYEFIRFSKNVFKLKGLNLQYSLSSTGFSAFSMSFFWVLSFNLVLDFNGRNIVDLFLNSPEMLFWLTILFSGISLYIIFEKGARESLNPKNKFPKKSKKVSRKIFFIRAVGLASSIFNQLIFSDSRVWFLWGQSFAFWIIASLMWVLNLLIFSQVLFVFSLILGFFAIYIFSYKIESFDLTNNEDTTVDLFSNVLWVSGCIITMAIAKSLIFGVYASLLFILIDVRKEIEKYLIKKWKARKNKTTKMV